MAVVLYCSGLHHTGVSMLLITQGIVMSPSTSQTVSSKTYWTLNPHFYHAINWSLVPVSIQKSSNLFAEKQALFSRHQKTCENLWCSCPQTTRQCNCLFFLPLHDPHTHTSWHMKESIGMTVWNCNLQRHEDIESIQLRSVLLS